MINYPLWIRYFTTITDSIRYFFEDTISFFSVTNVITIRKDLHEEVNKERKGGMLTWAPAQVRWRQILAWRAPYACTGWCGTNGGEGHSAASRRSCNSCREGCNIPCAGCHGACSSAPNPRPRNNRPYRSSGSGNRYAGSGTPHPHPTAAPVIPTRNPPCCWPCLWDPFCQTWANRNEMD